ncbi:hypothetical protein KALB_8326 [Kutzneria albida DSM 43870]|uniref:Esterase n=2 Tax=Kutzneria TaxID=43356 RepID=W5WLI0_9PSEU|nr:hypothetical protein KALB_8326 [Kutzneria albida DSM 43870]
MRRMLAFCAALTLCCALAPNAQAATRSVDAHVPSQAMGYAVPVRLLLPPDWSANSARTWPMLFLLHGSGDDYRAWTEHTDVASLTATTEAIVVMPEAGKCGNYSDWWNQGRGGTPAWETFHLTELPHYLREHYRANDQIAVAGLSMGGFGAMTYAARHPDLIRAAASYSGAVDPLDFPDATKAMGLLCPGSIWQNLWGDPAVPAQRELWQQHSPPLLAGNLRHTTLFMSSGNGKAGPLDPCCALLDDGIEQVVHAESTVLLNRLDELRIPVTKDFYGPGRHNWAYWQRELHRSLPMLLHAIGVS